MTSWPGWDSGAGGRSAPPPSCLGRVRPAVASGGAARVRLRPSSVLFLGLIAASAAFVFGVEGETPRISDRAAAAGPAAPVTTGSLALPPQGAPPQPAAPGP